MKTILKIAALIVAAAASITGAQAGVTYYHNDLAGSPIVATDANRATLWRESYRPYGERTVNASAASTNKVWFTSRRQDGETGLVYMGARYYDPVVGRFVSQDPKGFDESSGHSFNRYSYANDNPYRYRDTDGRWAQFLIWTARATGAGYLAGAMADAASQALAFGTIDWSMAMKSNAAIAGGSTGLLSGFGIAGAVESTAAKAAGEMSDFAANVAKGKASEGRVLSELGLEKNTSTIVTSEGRSIPDALTPTLSVEIKDAARVTLTRQLRIQTEAAREAGRESVLVTGEKTCVSGSCSRAFDTIIRRSDLGPQ